MNAIELSLFAHRVRAVSEEMAAALRLSAFSPNIRDRRDYSCAVFDADGGLLGQSAAIPVHLGSMAFAMRDVIGMDVQSGEQIVFNDPMCGGTHLPDVTLVCPVKLGRQTVAWVANRAHHADIGASVPGSMPLSRSLAEEGLVFSPRAFRGPDDPALVRQLSELRNPAQSRGDFAAQFSANLVGAKRVLELMGDLGDQGLEHGIKALNDYGRAIALDTLKGIPSGVWSCEDVMDSDGAGTLDIPLRLRMQISKAGVRADFRGSADQVAGNINCPRAVTFAALYYVFRCLMPPQTPDCAGTMSPFELLTRRGSILDPLPGAAVAAGNVETSTRLVDVVCGALAQALPDAVPAAAQGSMNNVAMGGASWSYYETLAGGHGGSASAAGAHGRHSHMTNTLNTPVEVAESHFPLRIETYRLRRGSGGAGVHNGGDGVERSYRLLDHGTITILAERHRSVPWGLAGGAAGSPGQVLLNGKRLDEKCTLQVGPGDVLTVLTPGGGGFGRPSSE